MPSANNKIVTDDEGASPAERVSAACREDNTDALEEVLIEMENAKKTNHAADFLFDIEFFECDPKTRLDKETPLHLVARYANDTSRYNSVRDAITMIKMMCEAGCDPRVTNKHGETPSRLPDMIPEDVRKELRQAEYLLNEGLALQNDANSDDDDAGDQNSASDSE
ncbi:hypothetical protein RJZ56_005056 [Blastomyces dermatitidis]